MITNSDMSHQMPFDMAICGMRELHGVIERLSPTHVISILDPGEDHPEFPASMSLLQLDFWDAHSLSTVHLDSIAGYPSLTHAKAILEFGKTLTKESRVLTHCWSGISRSSAAAFLLLCQHQPGDEFLAFEHIKILRPQAQPNRMLVEFGDRLLGARHRMVDCLG